MKGDAIKLMAERAATKTKPTNDEIAAAVVEGIDLLLGFFSAVDKIATGIGVLAECVDDNCQPAFVVSALVSPPRLDGEAKS